MKHRFAVVPVNAEIADSREKRLLLKPAAVEGLEEAEEIGEAGHIQNVGRERSRHLLDAYYAHRLVHQRWLRPCCFCALAFSSVSIPAPVFHQSA
jgi:hypothetical protein